MSFKKTNTNKIDALNEMIDSFLYNDITHLSQFFFDDNFFNKYKNEIFVIFSNLLRLGFIQNNNEIYIFNPPNFIKKKTPINIFYLFPRKEDYLIKSDKLEKEFDNIKFAFKEVLLEFKKKILTVNS
jgi:hypothetical protein